MLSGLVGGDSHNIRKCAMPQLPGQRGFADVPVMAGMLLLVSGNPWGMVTAPLFEQMQNQPGSVRHKLERLCLAGQALNCYPI